MRPRGITGFDFPVLLVVVGLALATSGWAAGHGEHDSDAGVVALDLFATGPNVDVLTVTNAGGTTQLRHQRSRDGGRTWSEGHALALGPHGIHGAHRGNDPQIAAFGDHVVVAWTLPGTSSWGSGPLATAVSQDGGATWRPGANPADDGSTGGHAYADLTVDAGGTFYLVWLDSRDGAQGLRTTVSHDFGKSWAPNTTADSQTCECCLNRLASPRAGEVWALYRDKDPRDMAVAVTSDGGASWTRRGVAGAFGWRFEGCPHVGGGLTFARSRAHAAVWTGADGQAGFYVVSSETDGGRTWRKPVRLGGASATHGEIAAAPGVLAAVWDETKFGASAIYSASSSDDAGTWTAPKRLSAVSSNASHPVAVGTDDGVLVGWTEKEGDAPLRFASTRLSAR